MAEPLTLDWRELLDWSSRILLGLFGWLWWAWGRERKDLDTSIARVSRDLAAYIDRNDRRLEEAGRHTSNLSTIVQGLPEKLRREWRDDMDRDHRRPGR